MALLGFFGKVPSRGDFVGAGLPSSFLDPWDAWTRDALAQLRARLGDGWQTAFLSSPVWRFALAPGVCGREGWAGVVASSVDGVGRAYPLTVARPVPADTGPGALLSSWRDGFERMIDLSLHMQEQDVAPEELAREVAATAEELDGMPFPLAAPPGAAGTLEPGRAVRIGPVAPGTTLAEGCGPALAQAGPQGSVFWRLGWGLPAAATVASGLPDPRSGPTMWDP